MEYPESWRFRQNNQLYGFQDDTLLLSHYSKQLDDGMSGMPVMGNSLNVRFRQNIESVGCDESRMIFFLSVNMRHYQTAVGIDI